MGPTAGPVTNKGNSQPILPTNPSSESPPALERDVTAWSKNPEHRLPAKTIFDLARASPGSAGLDLPSSHSYIIPADSEIKLIETGISDLLPQGTFGLILGRSSVSISGQQIIPRVVDSDFQGEFKIMVQSLTKTIQIRKGQRIAQ